MTHGGRLDEAGPDARLLPRADQPQDARSHPSAPGPVRTCVGCRVAGPKDALLRVVAVTTAGSIELVVDERRRMPGRGAWLHPDPACLELASRRRAFGRALRLQGTPDAAAVTRFVEQQAV